MASQIGAILSELKADPKPSFRIPPPAPLPQCAATPEPLRSTPLHSKAAPLRSALTCLPPLLARGWSLHAARWLGFSVQRPAPTADAEPALTEALARRAEAAAREGAAEAARLGERVRLCYTLGLTPWRCGRALRSRRRWRRSKAAAGCGSLGRSHAYRMHR